jgi:tetratricopeptide (TPR) repeat protein
MSTETYKSEIITEEFTESRALLSHLCREAREGQAVELITDQRTDDINGRVWATNNLAFLAWDAKRFTESLLLLLEIEPLALKCTNDETRANFHLGLSNALCGVAETENQPAYFDRVFIELEAARYFFELAGNHRFIGGVENNIGYLKIKVGLAAEAHEHLQKARQSFLCRDDDDRAYRLAEIDNTEAQAYLAENNPQEAIHYAQLSVDALRYGDEPVTLEKSIETLERALLALKDCNRTQLTAIALREAGSVAKAAVRLGISRTAVEKRIEKHPELEVYAHRGKPRGVNAERFG